MGIQDLSGMSAEEFKRFAQRADKSNRGRPAPMAQPSRRGRKWTNPKQYVYGSGSRPASGRTTTGEDRLQAVISGLLEKGDRETAAALIPFYADNRAGTRGRFADRQTALQKGRRIDKEAREGGPAAAFRPVGNVKRGGRKGGGVGGGIVRGQRPGPSKIQQELEADRLFSKQRNREREDFAWKLKMLKQLLGRGMGRKETTQEVLYDNAGAPQRVPLKTVSSDSSELVRMLMGML